LKTVFQKLSYLGFDGVELMVKRPSRLDGDQLRALSEEYGLKLTGLCTGHIYGEDGLGLVLPNLSINQEAVNRLKEFIDFAANYLEPGRMVNIGRSRGLGDPENIQATLETACAAFQELADYANPKDVRLILEPVSRDEVNFIHSTQDGLATAKMVDRPNFGLMLDTYHMWKEDADPIQSIYDAAPYIWHMHFSDSNRCYPGSGKIDYERVVDALMAIGYQQFVSLEIHPWPDPDEAARQSIRYLRKYIPTKAD
jgi:sugar phosphate isomerase/epimerase